MKRWMTVCVAVSDYGEILRMKLVESGLLTRIVKGNLQVHGDRLTVEEACRILKI